MTYLHDLLQTAQNSKMENTGQQTSKSRDIYQQLTQRWTGLLYHDQFPELRRALVQGLVGQGGLLEGLHDESEAAVMHVQNDVVDFVQQQGSAELPQYDVSAVMK